MSDSSQGSGWWLASDGKWYPPEPVVSAPFPVVGPPEASPPPQARPPHPRPPEVHPPGYYPTALPYVGGGTGPQPVPDRAPRPVPGMPSSNRAGHGRLRLLGPTVLVIGAVVLLAVGAGSAVGIGYALKGSPPPGGASRKAAPDTGAGGPSPSTSTASPKGMGAVPPTTGPAPSSAATSSAPPPGSQTGPPGNMVTQSVTQDVLATTWAGFAHAMVSDDRASLSTYTTPSALNDSIATLDCGCLPGPMTYSTTAISNPTERSYPLSFMAGLSGLGYNQVSQTWWVVFTKASAATPWVVAFFASYAVGGGLDGMTSSSSASPIAVQYPLEAAPQDYVDYFQHLDTTQDPGSGAPTGFAQNNMLNTEVNNTTRIDAERSADGLKETYTHTVDQVSPVFAQVVDGSVYGAMECFSVKMTDDVTSADGSPIVQPADQGAWGYRVPPGSYSSLDFSEEHVGCVEESATSGVTLTSDSGGSYAIATTPSG